MIKHAARIFLLLTGAALLAYYLPIGWHLLTAERQRSPFIQYSDTGKGFIFTTVNFDGNDSKVVYTDRDGNTYDRDAVEQMLPLTYYLQLYKNGTMPSEINGVKITNNAISREQFALRVRPDNLDMPSVELFTLFEAESTRAKLEVPEDFMRLRDDGRIEFIVPKTNTINIAKSALYTEAFARAKFVFPAKASGSNPNPRKSYDEGIYLTDSKNQTFRLRQVKGAPELTRISEAPGADSEAWRALRPRHIIVNEIQTRELRALIIDETGAPWLIVGKYYRLIKLPVTTYKPSQGSLMIRGNLLNRLITVQTETSQEAIALDREYKVIDRYDGMLTSPNELTANKVSCILFPVSWWLEDDSSGYFGFYTKYGVPLAFALNAVLAIAYALWLGLRKKLRLARAPELVVIALTGLCGLIPALLLPRAD